MPISRLKPISKLCCLDNQRFSIQRGHTKAGSHDLTGHWVQAYWAFLRSKSKGISIPFLCSTMEQLTNCYEILLLKLFIANFFIKKTLLLFFYFNIICHFSVFYKFNLSWFCVKILPWFLRLLTIYIDYSFAPVKHYGFTFGMNGARHLHCMLKSTWSISVNQKLIYYITCTGHHKFSRQSKDAVIHVKLNDDGARCFIGGHHHLSCDKTDIW